jgi:hypothetical protein
LRQRGVICCKHRTPNIEHPISNSVTRSSRDLHWTLDVGLPAREGFRSWTLDVFFFIIKISSKPLRIPGNRQ